MGDADLLFRRLEGLKVKEASVFKGFPRATGKHLSGGLADGRKDGIIIFSNQIGTSTLSPIFKKNLLDLTHQGAFYLIIRIAPKMGIVSSSHPFIGDGNPSHK